MIVAPWPTSGKVDLSIIKDGDTAKEIISTIRDLRNKNNLKPKEPVKLFVKSANLDDYATFKSKIVKLGNLSSFESTHEDVPNSASFIANNDNFFMETGELNKEDEKDRLLKELSYNQGFFKAVSKKLANERFVQNAPAAVVETERQKLNDAEGKIKILEESLAKLN
jgi:valyl-tRNA synthetase